jgi:hypothetical protein
MVLYCFFKISPGLEEQANRAINVLEDLNVVLSS